jgi:hypothetical protein
MVNTRSLIFYASILLLTTIEHLHPYIHVFRHVIMNGTFFLLQQERLLMNCVRSFRMQQVMVKDDTLCLMPTTR